MLTNFECNTICLLVIVHEEKNPDSSSLALFLILSLNVYFRSRLIDGTEVFQEIYCKPRQGHVHEDMPRRGPEQPSVGHHECINDLIVSKSPQNFIVTAGRDGVVKIWK